MYRRISTWDDFIDFWGGIVPRHLETVNLVDRTRELYRFLAARYLPVDDWVLMFSEDDGAHELRYGGVITS
ncbi:MAG: hypothetical protein ACPGQM_10510 [Alphaproteobacteria bacterium]